MEHDADRNFPHSKNESNSPTLNSQTLNNQLPKGAWLQRSFTLSTIHSSLANAFGVNPQPLCFFLLETRSLPALARCYPRSFTLITRTARARASYPSCVAVYPRD